MAVFRAPSSRGQPPWHRHYKSELLGKMHIPIEGVVPDLSSVVENTSLSGLDQLLKRSTTLRQQIVEIIYITTDQEDPAKLRLVMFTIVIVNGFSRNRRLESVASIGQLRKDILLNRAHCDLGLQIDY